ncbi:NPR2-domain-containing protein [Dendrothele bispora CBS 962.96]|uniref:NPR2-domain-containing protein n=1 Tax=Dendrothele bispora (strain CBS 962.96) TaxID=1314807 RepID=A0A4V4HDT4_DENBC|nr:NPR2-domain-containing protein [Dendrothele bispora CBS 962.96]
MPSDGDSFLPRIQSVFYAGFDLVTGPKIIVQVPEDLIAVTQTLPPTSVPPTPASESPGFLYSPHKTRSASASHILFHFEEISKYVIPPPALCGRLVTCTTRGHRIIGFPSQLRGDKYLRNFFRYNLCFVFEKSADLSCYEPIVRKVSRVLSSCEAESGFLSSSSPSTMHAIIEQLYEDLNSYSETSIPIDSFNSIELKIFPFYPNPQAVKDWMVPVALINLTRRIEDNWDLTMAKVCRFIDGVNHVSRIAQLAECDIELTRQAISHLLYYQVIMTIDIFQYSNMYALCNSIQWLADEAHVKEECGPYCTKPENTVPDWPKLLHLYSRLRPGKMVSEWMEEHNVNALGIDVRRFTSFGVIKGFLRRVHRWPVLVSPSRGTIPTLHPNVDTDTDVLQGRKRGKSFTEIAVQNVTQSNVGSPNIPPQAQQLFRGRASQTLTLPAPSISSDQATSAPTSPRETGPSGVEGKNEVTFSPPAPASQLQHRTRRSSAAERILEQLRNRDQQNVNRVAPHASPRTSVQYPSEHHSPSLAGSGIPGVTTTSSTPQDQFTSSITTHTRFASGGSQSRRPSLTSPYGSNIPQSAQSTLKTALSVSRPRLSRSPSAPLVRTFNGVLDKNGATPPLPVAYPPELIQLLDGEHHTDELGVKFEAGWPLLEKWLIEIGGGSGPGDLGKISIICS